MEYTYKGRTVSEEEYRDIMAKVEKGECPFCGRTGLTARYGSKAKHIRACASKK